MSRVLPSFLHICSSLTLEDGTEGLFRNAGKETASHPKKDKISGYMNCVFCDVGTAICVLSKLPAFFESGVMSLAVIRRPFIAGKLVLSQDSPCKFVDW